MLSFRKGNIFCWFSLDRKTNVWPCALPRVDDGRRVHSIPLQIYVLFLFLQSYWPVFFIIFASKVQIVFAKSISKSVDFEKRQISPRMHYLWTDNTILPQYYTTCAQIEQRFPQYCTACGHMIQSCRNIALLAYT